MHEMSPLEVQAAIENKEGYKVIDVREPMEVEAGRIPESINIPLGEIPESIAKLDKDGKYILVCRSGARSFNATLFLASKGFHVTNMAGGMMDWNGPVSSDLEGVYEG
nr:rhodanese-like domain-containing protein [Litchfieldia alkalitelluris]